MKVALIGCGFIGKMLARALAYGTVNVSLLVVHDLVKRRSREVASLFIQHPPHIAKDREEILSSSADLIVEAASIKAARRLLIPALESSKKVMIMSVGSLADPSFLEEVRLRASEKGCKVYIPSGAIGGLDLLKAASLEEIRSVKLTTTKHPKSLANAPLLAEKNIEPGDIDKPTMLFAGTAREAINHLPANVNVAISLSLAGIGVDKTWVEVVADPQVKRNIHRIEIKGSFGRMSCQIENEHSPQNPKTSYLAALSAIATFKRAAQALQIGT
jgi:aspartate dehydrogenase